MTTFLLLSPRCPVPTSSVVIYDRNFKPIDKVAGPFEEDSTESLICDTNEGSHWEMLSASVKSNLTPFLPPTGNPLPVVHWWKGSRLIDTNYFVVNQSIARNVLTLPNLTRDDLLLALTCQAYNTNLTVPVSRTITLDLYRTWLFFLSPSPSSLSFTFRQVLST